MIQREVMLLTRLAVFALLFLHCQSSLLAWQLFVDVRLA